jgi:hypothetical protein
MRKIYINFILLSALMAEPSAFDAGDLDLQDPYGLTED